MICINYLYQHGVFFFCFFFFLNIVYTFFYILIDVTLLLSGSENNSLYLYYKGLSKTLLTFKFDTVKSVLDKDKKEDDTNEFVSAVCWRALPDGVRFILTYIFTDWRIINHSVSWVYERLYILG